MQVARRYAEALADAASDQNVLVQVAEELHAFASLVASHKELIYVFETPALPADDKLKVVDALVARSGAHTLVSNFLRVLVQNNRIQYVRAIDTAFASEVDRRSGVVTADVTTAKPLTAEEQSVLSARLAAMTGKKMKLEFSTDDELIGGVVTRIGSKIYDGSIRAKLDAVKRQMTGGSRV
jgi:F-type H+-transporting ATPase subunit delta